MNNIRNDIQSLNEFKKDGWEIIGSGFKHPINARHEKVNQQLEDKIIPWYTWLYAPCINYPGVYWLLQKEQ